MIMSTLYGIGVDIQDIAVISRMLRKHGKDLINYVFTREEWNGSKQGSMQAQATALTIIFSLKESIAKALGTGIDYVRWTDIEIAHNHHLAYVRFWGNGQREMERVGIEQVILSWARMKKSIVSMAILIGGKVAIK